MIFAKMYNITVTKENLKRSSCVWHGLIYAWYCLDNTNISTYMTLLYTAKKTGDFCTIATSIYFQTNYFSIILPELSVK